VSMSARMLLVGGAALMGALATTANATPPGHNGRLGVVGGSFSGNGFLITKTPGRHDALRRKFPVGEIAPSPNGRRLAVMTRHGLYLYDASGRQRKVLTRKHVSGLGSVSFSRDGSRVLFQGPVGDKSRGGRFYVVGTNGRGLHRIRGAAAHGYNPRWSPDGRTIAFLRPRPGSQPVVQEWGDLYVMPSRGGPARRVFRPGFKDGVVGSFDWAPSGKRFVVTTEFNGFGFGKPDPQLGTLVLTSGGHFLRRIATDAQNPVWSPDGRKIAFNTGDGLHTPILTMDTRGGHRRRAIDFPSTIVRAIVWLPRA
jgi:Tol biopolymer transport system component